jgi:hypothetical protein
MKAPVLGLIVASAAFGASSIYLWDQLEQERARGAQVAETTRALKARVGELEQARNQLEAARLANSRGFISGQIDAGHPAVAVPQPGTETKAEGEPGKATWSTVRHEPSPAMIKMMRSQMRASNRRIYADVGEKLGLSQEMSNMLIDLITDQQMPDPDRFKPTDDPAEMRRMGQDWQRQNEQAISDLIGPGKAQALKDYQATLPARMEVDNLARQLEGSDVALSAEQRKKLIDVYVAERARVAPPQYVEGMDGEAFGKNMTAWQEDYEARVAAEAGRILNPEQFTTYNEIQQWQKEIRTQFANAPGARMLRRMGAGTMNYVGGAAGAVSLTVEGQVPDSAAEKKQP